MDLGDLSDGASSDSCPSEDNLDDNDMAKLLPSAKTNSKKSKNSSSPKKQRNVNNKRRRIMVKINKN